MAPRFDEPEEIKIEFKAYIVGHSAPSDYDQTARVDIDGHVNINPERGKIGAEVRIDVYGDDSAAQVAAIVSRLPEAIEKVKDEQGSVLLNLDL